MRTLRLVMGGVALAILLELGGAGPATSPARVERPASAAENRSVLLGLYDGSDIAGSGDLQALEAWQGKDNAVLNLFTNWDTSPVVTGKLFGEQLPAIWANGSVPMVTWEPFTGKDTPRDIDVRIARGDYDRYLAAWAEHLQAFLVGPDGTYGTADDRRCYLRLAHEMNGDWYPWAASKQANSPADYVAMWRHVHDLFTGRGLDPTRLQWVWAVNAEDVGPHRAEDFFPGDDYVDWVGVDGYNWGSTAPWSSWSAPSAVFGGMTGRLRAISRRPLALAEVGSSSATPSGSDVEAKSRWISELYDFAVNADARLVVWFNTDKETDWAVFGGRLGDEAFTFHGTTYRAYRAYREAVSRSWFVAADPGNPRLLDDAKFSGARP